MKQLLLTLCILLLFSYQAKTQTRDPIAMADALHRSGKIYVVVAVISIVFIGIVSYLFRIDRRIKKIEQQQ